MLNKKRLLTPGPTPLPEEVRLALAQDMIHHRKGQFKEIMQRVQGHLRELFGTTQPVLPLSCSGSGAMTAAPDVGRYQIQCRLVYFEKGTRR